MVELEEVEDPELEAPQPGPSSIDDDENSEDYSDTGPSISSSFFLLSLSPSLSSKALHIFPHFMNQQVGYIYR